MCSHCTALMSLLLNCAAKGKQDIPLSTVTSISNVLLTGTADAPLVGCQLYTATKL